MIAVIKVPEDERSYCSHCDKPAAYKLYFTNPAVVQQGCRGAMCKRCMGRLKKEIAKATTPNSRKPKPAKSFAELLGLNKLKGVTVKRY